MLTPTNWNWVCCGRCRSTKVQHIDQSGKVLQQKKSVSERLSQAIVYLNYLVCFSACIAFFVAMLYIHVPTYTLKQKGFWESAFINELVSIFALLVLFPIFRQKEVTEEEIQEKMKQFKVLLEKKIQSQFMGIQLDNLQKRSNTVDDDHKQSLLPGGNSGDSDAQIRQRAGTVPNAKREDEDEQSSL